MFLVVGGAPEDELTALAAVLQTLHDQPFVGADELPLLRGAEGEPDLGVDALPIRIVDEPDAWRQVGLEEHRLSISFEVTLPLPSSHEESLEPILERELRVDYGDGIESGRAER
jgi:hypothetical protein